MLSAVRVVVPPFTVSGALLSDTLVSVIAPPAVTVKFPETLNG